ncbi:MAG: hypothetical protein ABII16_03735 [Patescibacteria group bacterium]
MNTVFRVVIARKIYYQLQLDADGVGHLLNNKKKKKRRWGFYDTSREKTPSAFQIPPTASLVGIDTIGEALQECLGGYIAIWKTHDIVYDAMPPPDFSTKHGTPLVKTPHSYPQKDHSAPFILYSMRVSFHSQMQVSGVQHNENDVGRFTNLIIMSKEQLLNDPATLGNKVLEQKQFLLHGFLLCEIPH